MSEDYQKQIEDAVQTVRRGEGKTGLLTDEDAKIHIERQLALSFAKSWDGTGPVPDSFFTLLNWAAHEYFLKLLMELRHRDAVKEHEQNQARSAKG
jgi:hypothetical protein